MKKEYKVSRNIKVVQRDIADLLETRTFDYEGFKRNISEKGVYFSGDFYGKTKIKLKGSIIWCKGGNLCIADLNKWKVELIDEFPDTVIFINSRINIKFIVYVIIALVFLFSLNLVNNGIANALLVFSITGVASYYLLLAIYRKKERIMRDYFEQKILAKK